VEDLYYFTVCCFFILKSYCFINGKNTFDKIGKDISRAQIDVTFAFSIETEPWWVAWPVSGVQRGSCGIWWERLDPVETWQP